MSNLGKFGRQIQFAGFTTENVVKSAPTLVLWGGSAVAGGKMNPAI